MGDGAGGQAGSVIERRPGSHPSRARLGSRIASLAVVVAVAAGSAAVAGCEKLNSVSSSVSPCFKTLPIARVALGNQGAFIDIARLRGSAIPSFGRVGPLGRKPGRPAIPGVVMTTTVPTAQPPGSGSVPTSPRTLVPFRQRDVCLVAFRGPFDLARISHLVGPQRTGRYAVVIVAVRTQTVRAVVLTDRLKAPLHNR